MTLELKQVRPCDGQCCRDSPRWPNAEGTDCIYHDTAGGKENRGCAIMRGDAKVPTECPITWKGMTPQQIFDETCVAWPQKNSLLEKGDTDGCCWQVVDI